MAAKMTVSLCHLSALASEGTFMDVAIIVAIIAAAVSALGWIATAALSAFYGRRTSRLAALQAHTEKQLAELYGPLAFLVLEGRGTFSDLVQTQDPRKIFSPGHNPTQSEIDLWLFWVDHDFMPRNEKIQTLLASKTHLIEGESLPASYVAFLDHHNNWRVSHGRWKEKGVPYSWHSKVDWPASFEAEVVDTFKMLLARHANLIGAATRGYGQGAVTQTAPHAQGHEGVTLDLGGRTPSLSPPGWYPDSQGTSRWFDGSQWTEHVR